MFKIEVEDESSCSLPEFCESSAPSTENVLSEISRLKYESAYEAFLNWRVENNTTSFSENVLLKYFIMLAEKYSSSSLWSYYSMLKSTLASHHDIHIENYKQLQMFLKRQSHGYTPKKAKTLTSENIRDFIEKAPNKKYLLTKVVVIMGVMGACRTKELNGLSINNVEDFGRALVVKIPETKTKITRTFTITGECYNICKKYMNLRPANTDCTSFFLNYVNNKCTPAKLGINKLASMGKVVATFLKLKDPEMYTGHCLRKSSAILSINGGGDCLQNRLEPRIDTNKQLEPQIDLTPNIQIQATSSTTEDSKPFEKVMIMTKVEERLTPEPVQVSATTVESDEIDSTLKLASIRINKMSPATQTVVLQQILELTFRALQEDRMKNN